MNIKKNHNIENGSTNDLDEKIIGERLLLSLYKEKLLNKLKKHEKK